MTPAQRLRKAKTWSDLVATWVTILGALAGGAWALNEYSDKVHDDKVAATLRYEQRYNTAPMWDIRERLETFWSGSRTTEVMKGLDAPPDYVVKSLAADLQATADTEATINFFDGLGTCLCAGLCDMPTAIQLFGKNADDFYELNRTFIRATREHLRDAEYAQGLVAIANAYTSRQSQ